MARSIARKVPVCVACNADANMRAGHRLPGVRRGPYCMLDPGLRREDAISRPRALRYFRLIVVLGVAAILAPVCLAQSYPQRPIRIIALSSPGSGPDIVGRLVGSRLTEAWGQQVIVDPRPGATGIIGA